MDASLAPVSEIIKLLKEVKKVMSDFPLVFKRLASTLERIVPIITEIVKLQKRLNPSSKDLKFLTETTRRAKQVVRECPLIRGYDIPKKKRDSLSRRSQEATTGISTGKSSFDEDEQRNILESIMDNVKDKNKQRVILESVKDNVQDEDEQRVILESIKDNVKGKNKQLGILESFKDNVQDEDEQQVILESIKDHVKGKNKQLVILENFKDNVQDEDEQQVILESIKDHVKGKNKKQVILRSVKDNVQDEDEQHVILESIKDHVKGKNKQLVILESFKDNGRRKQKIDSPFLVYDGRLTNDSTSFTTTLADEDEDEQQAILESIKKK
ncbi:unnamed protein product [Eruca vesicaria subsp. sativa]|uniref:RPW8 domain-containing protein n=1 Tax=Eruca vesicaria subsp. sativa TaxID=29727 RepID=A0ABC8KRI5_ERUVS|nr:unnamed protein product [Eruca vesicaria subsp. sativa]